MEIKKVVDFKELDALIPLIEKRRNITGVERYSSLIGYLSWLAINLPLKNFQIWYGISKDTTTIEGYIIAQITHRYFIPECHIVDAFLNINNEDVTKKVYENIIDWAKENGCVQVSINTNREDAFSRKYGFEIIGSTMIKKI